MPAYLHQIHRLQSGALEDFFEAMTNEYLPAMEAHGARLVGCWETVAEQGTWPEVVELWEFDDFNHIGAAIRQQHAPTGSRALRDWKAKKGSWISETQGYLCVKSDLTPTVEQMREQGTRAALVLHETMTVAPSRQAEYLRALEDMYWPRVAQPAGRTLIGLYWSPWKATKAFNFWGVATTWDEGSIMSDTGGHFGGRDNELWLSLGLELRTDWDDRLMVPTPFSPVHG